MARLVVCSECEERKPYYGRGKCANCWKKDWIRRNPDKHKTYCKKWQERNPERWKEIKREGSKRNWLKKKVFYRMRSDYLKGLSVDELLEVVGFNKL